MAAINRANIYTSEIERLKSEIRDVPSIQEILSSYGGTSDTALAVQKAMQNQQDAYRARLAELSQTTAPSNATLSSLNATAPVTTPVTAPVTAPTTAPAPVTAPVTTPVTTPVTAPVTTPTFDFTSTLKAQQDASTKSYADALAANQTALSKQNSDFLTNWNSSAATLKNDILAGVDAKNQAFGTEATKGFMGAFKNFQIPTNQQTGVNMGNYNDNRNAAADQWWSQYVTGRR